ncbi:hypothetical protein WA026_009943 [Henosepilachna vigintioctopunctata]|uniref:Coronin n=1 Tax=Henosepilachna vigintioctopunctata TaxID=420089 RepID=A0AAW1TLI9_9CUCU
MEVTDKEPYLVEGIRHSGEQTKGACLVPKRALNVMQGEVNRILQLTSSSVIPVTYQVPRKTYRDFHADLYPNTVGFKTDLNAERWFKGENSNVPKISLNPADRENGEAPIIVYRGSLLAIREEFKAQTHFKKSEDKISISKVTAPCAIINIALNPSESEEDINKYANGKINVFKTKDNNYDMNNSSSLEESRDKSYEDDCEKTDSEKHVKDEESDEKLNDSSECEKICPPKPLPRASRTGSVCEISEEGYTPKPVARPRTNSCVPVVSSVSPIMTISGGYKPRLGPKPFTPLKLNESKSFDQVFCVPQVPGQNQTNGHDLKSPTAECKSLESETVNEDFKVIENEDKENNRTPDRSESENVDEKDISVDSGYSSKTPTTAERRRMFETSENEENLDSIDSNNFERGGGQRASIAERKKMYENKSLSFIDSAAKEKSTSSPVLLRRKGSFKNPKNVEDDIPKDDNRKSVGITKQHSHDPQTFRKSEVITAPTPKRTSTVFGRVSKFRHLKVTPAHKSQHIENLRNVSRQIPGECDGFHANPEFLAVALSGPGGRISILNRNKPGKLPDGVIPSLVQGSNIMDFCWDPFNNYRLAVACDDGIIKLWQLEEGGLKEPTNEPHLEFNAHSDKIYFIKFHPTAEDVIASGSYDMTIKIWDLTDCTEKIVLKGHTDQIFSFAWSPCGAFCSTVSKDGKIRVYNPRISEAPIREGKGPEGNRGARIVWALDGHYLAVTGFDKVSQRLISVYKINDLDNPLNTIVSDVSPAILIPFYDEDSSTLFLTGKGDSTIYAYEVTEEAPYLCPLSHHRCPTLHQGLSFLPKNVCDVANVEFASALRLTNNTIEPLSFTVPRIKTELFQDDLFPPTRITWEPSISGKEWFNGKDKLPQRISLQPSGMSALSDQKTSQNIADKANEKSYLNKSASSPFIGATKPMNRFDPELSSQIKEKQNEVIIINLSI